MRTERTSVPSSPHGWPSEEKTAAETSSRPYQGHPAEKSPLDNSGEKSRIKARAVSNSSLFFTTQAMPRPCWSISTQSRACVASPARATCIRPASETGDLGHHICIHKNTSSTIERHSQNHMESMKLSHPLSSLAPYAAGQEQERKEKTAAPLMHPSQRISRGIKWVKASTSPCPKARGLWRRTIPLLSGITIISAGHGV